MPTTLLTRALACACLVAGLPAAADDFNQLRPLLEKPTQAFKPSIRYWLPGAQADSAVIAQDMHSIAQAGFGSVEVADLPQNAGPVDPVRYGWGTPAWRSVLEATLRAAAKNDLRVSLTIGPAWPVVVPGLDPNGAQAAKELVVGWKVLSGGDTYAAPLPEPAKSRAPQITQQHLVTAQAWQCADQCAETPIRLKAGSLVQLKTDATLHWQAPQGGHWIVIGYWQRGTGQTAALAIMQQNPAASAPQAYVPDHFAAAGTQAVTGYWESNILTPALKDLIREHGRDLFEDSLELDSHLNWTPGLPDAFAQHRSYRLEPLLPLVIVDNQRHFGAPRTRVPTFELASAVPHASDVYTDYERTLSDLYREHHLQPLANWAHSLGLGYRVQTYGQPMDMGAAAEQADTPEGENLTLNNELDLFRVLDTAGQIQGRSQFSTECCSVIGGSYRQSWPDMLNVLQLHYAGGVNQITVHGYPYSGKVPTARWPGWSPFEPFGPSLFSPNIDNGFSEAWGPRQPSWPDVPLITGYLARTQALLRHGTAQTELVVLNDELDHEGPLLADPSLAQAGYHYGFISSQQVLSHGLAWQGKQLVMGKAHWQALLIDGSRPLAMDVQQRLQAVIAQGAPVLVVGGNLALEGATRVDDYAQALTALQARHVQPGFVPGVAGVYSVHRRDAGNDYYWLVNTGKQVYKAQIALSGHGKLVQLDAWSGKVVPVAFTHQAPDSVGTDVELQPGQAMAFALGEHFAATAAPAVQWQAPVALSNATLQLEDWGPAADGYGMRVQHKDVGAAPQGPWSEVDGLRNLSGRATYQGSFQLAAGATAARLLVPAADGVWQLKVNGRAVAVDPHLREVVISEYAHAGRNTVELTMASTLNNRMKQQEASIYGPLPFQTYGLQGPLTVQLGR
ncbi:glycosyl hydrolase [Pseudomonas putida]